MAKTKSDSKEYAALKRDIEKNELRNLYLFYGEERYLLEHYLGQIKKLILSEGMGEFNYKKIDGRTAGVNDIREAVDSLPVFAQRTLVEVDDFDIFKSPQNIKEELASIFSDMPEYVCLIFVYDVVEYKADRKSKINTELLKNMSVVEFAGQQQSDLINWIGRRFKALGKQIDRQTADYLIFVSGGLMTKLVSEIEKIAAYSKDNLITKESIDAVVDPVIDAVIYKMTNAILDNKFDKAIEVLSDLYAMQQPPHRIIYSVSLRVRQMYSAWISLERGKSAADIMDMFDMRNDYQVRGIITGARRAGEKWCKEALKLCVDTAYKLNSSPIDNNELLFQLVLKMASIY